MRKPKKFIEKMGPEWPRMISIAAVVLCAAIVAVNLVAWALFRDEVVVKREMEAMVADYYENYAYDGWTMASLEERKDRGIPEVTLRVLLSYDGAKNADKEALFLRAGCNMIETGARIYPEEPYGRKNYRVEIKYSCNFE